jgi:hypothetical protein
MLPTTPRLTLRELTRGDLDFAAPMSDRSARPGNRVAERLGMRPIEEVPWRGRGR